MFMESIYFILVCCAAICAESRENLFSQRKPRDLHRKMIGVGILGAGMGMTKNVVGCCPPGAPVLKQIDSGGPNDKRSVVVINKIGTHDNANGNFDHNHRKPKNKRPVKKQTDEVREDTYTDSNEDPNENEDANEDANYDVNDDVSDDANYDVNDDQQDDEETDANYDEGQTDNSDEDANQQSKENSSASENPKKHNNKKKKDKEKKKGNEKPNKKRKEKNSGSKKGSKSSGGSGGIGSIHSVKNMFRNGIMNNHWSAKIHAVKQHKDNRRSDKIHKLHYDQLKISKSRMCILKAIAEYCIGEEQI